MSGVSVMLSKSFSFFMAFLQVFRVRTKKFQVLYPIICSNTIFMVNFFLRFEFSPKMLFHNMTVLKHSFPVNPDSIISVTSKLWLTSFKGIPVGRNIIKIFISSPPVLVHRAQRAFLGADYFATIFKPTDITNHYPTRIAYVG